MEKYYDIMELFDKIHERSEPFDFESIGIKSIQLDIINKYDGILPLGAVFKNIHATKNIPMIKYSPGPKRESMYRLYSENISQSGSKIPLLSYNDITKYNKLLIKSESVSLILQETIDDKEIIILITFKKMETLILKPVLKIVFILIKLRTYLKINSMIF